jgi:RNA polymerase sigma-H factor
MQQVNFGLINRLAFQVWGGDSTAKDTLIAECYPFVIWVRKEQRLWPPRGCGPEDMHQEGMIGVLQALTDWHPDLQPNFCNFARICVERDLIEMLRMATRQKRRGQNEAVSLDEPVTDPDGMAGLEDRLARWKLPDPSGLSRDPADLVGGNEASFLLAELSAGASGLQRSVLDHCILGQQSYEATAKVLGVKKKTLDNARQRLRKRWLRRANELVNDGRLTGETREILRRIVDPSHERQRSRAAMAGVMAITG